MRKFIFTSRNNSVHALLASALLLSGSIASASEDSGPAENAYLDEMPVVLSVSRLAQRVDEAPAAVTIIDRQMIKDSGAWDLSEAMRLVPGMFVAYHAARFYSTDSTVTYHGLMSETMSHRMQVLVDGRSVYSTLYGGVIWSDIPVAMDDIERIEVVRGPNAASYGANSFIGVINIITTHSAETQGKHLSLSAGRGRQEAVARHGSKSDNLTYRITASLRNDKGENADINNPNLHDGIAPGDSYIWTKNKFDDKKISQLTFRADYQVNPSDTLEFQLGYNGGQRQAGETNDWYSPDKQANNYFEMLHWRRALEKEGELSVQFYHMVESSSAPLINTDPGSSNFNARRNGDVVNQRYDLEVQHTFSPSKHTRLAWGGSVRQDEVHAPNDLVTDEARFYRLSRLFSNLEWRARSDLIFNLGAMVENNNYTGTDITPRAAVNWHFLPEHTLRVSQSHATRTPSVYEKRYEEYLRPKLNPSLPELLPERVISREVGYLGQFSGVDVDFRLFHDNFSDLIADNQNSVKNGNMNSGKASIKGFETQLKWNIGPRTRLIHGYSHSVVTSPDLDGVPYTNSVPTNSHSLMLSHRFNNDWSTSLVGYYVGETHFSRTDQNLNQGRGFFIDAVRRWDGRIAYTFHNGGTNGELALIVQNLADAQYFEFRHDNQVPGRTAWLNLKLDL